MFIHIFTAKPNRMYATLLALHSAFRWLVLFSLLAAIMVAADGYRRGRAFTKRDNALRHWTATIAHLQLLIGMILYSQSPEAGSYWKGTNGLRSEAAFFGLFHLILMLAAILLLSIGSALAKRQPGHRDKFRTMLTWFLLALLLILLANPWPFSPLAHPPLSRLI